MTFNTCDHGNTIANECSDCNEESFNDVWIHWSKNGDRTLMVNNGQTVEEFLIGKVEIKKSEDNNEITSTT